jgi:S1-C subfamily serine protease
VFNGFELGRRLHWSFDKGKYGRIESTLGAIPAVTATLVIVWLLAAMLGRMPFVGLSNSVNDALIVQALTRELPPAPAVLATFNHQIDPNSPPTLFTEQPEPQASFAFSPSEFQAAAPKAAHSIVRVTGFGCGGQGSGSGFVVSKDLVLTNAHVVAGVERPIIKYNNHSFEAIPVVFDASQDIAVLRVIRQAHPFNAPPLPLTHTPAANNTTVAVLGYPGGNYAATPGIVRSNLPVRGNNIYGLGVVTRNTYDIQTSIWQGSSGSPIVLADGRVAGIIFAKYDAVNDYAIALASSHILPAVEQAETAYRRISTGSCLAG